MRHKVPIGRRIWRLSRRLRFLAWRVFVVPWLWIGSHLERWFRSRRLRWLLWGTPALFIAMILIAVVIWQSQKPKAELVDRYRTAANKAIASDDYDAAELFLRKILQIEKEDREAKYRLAGVLGQKGNTVRANEILRELAPMDRMGYPPAHYLIAQNLARHKQQWSSDELKELTHHLQCAAKSEALRVDANQMLGQIHFAMGDIGKALACFQSIADRRPELQLPIAHMLHVVGKEEESTAVLQKAMRHFESRLESDPNDVVSRIGLAKCCFLFGDFARCERLLVERFDDSDAEACRKQMAELYVQQSDRLRRQDEQGTLGIQLRLLQRALECDPESLTALNRLAMLSGYTGEEGMAARASLKDVLTSGIAPATVHVILGTQAADRGDFDTARTHLVQACRLGARMPAVLNNLAWVLLHEATPDLGRARKLADVAIEALPENAEFRATRGQILLQLKDWDAALLDLEIALRDLGHRENLHRALATVYQQLGDEEQAEKHLEQIQRMKQEKVPSTEAPKG